MSFANLDMFASVEELSESVKAPRSPVQLENLYPVCALAETGIACENRYGPALEGVTVPHPLLGVPMVRLYCFSAKCAVKVAGPSTVKVALASSGDDRAPRELVGLVQFTKE